MSRNCRYTRPFLPTDNRWAAHHKPLKTTLAQAAETRRPGVPRWRKRLRPREVDWKGPREVDGKGPMAVDALVYHVGASGGRWATKGADLTTPRDHVTPMFVAPFTSLKFLSRLSSSFHVSQAPFTSRTMHVCSSFNVYQAPSMVPLITREQSSRPQGRPGPWGPG